MGIGAILIVLFIIGFSLFGGKSAAPAVDPNKPSPVVPDQPAEEK